MTLTPPIRLRQIDEAIRRSKAEPIAGVSLDCAEIVTSDHFSISLAKSP
jgi:hypothetical protein